MTIKMKLQLKFILVATLTVFIIIAGALGLINAITYARMQSSVESVLQYISENDGNVPQHAGPQDSGWLGDQNGSNDTPEFSYQTRYFSVLVNHQGYATNININHIAAFTQEEAVEYARMTIASGETKGFLKKNRANYAYLITQRNDGNYLIVILDCTRDVAAVESFMRYSAWFGFICLILYVLILAPLSGLAIKPFIRNMENQKRFITNAGHELKTPIAIISANAEAMELISGKNQWTESILKQAKRLTNLIADLIFLSKVGEGSHADMVLTAVDASKTVTDVAESFQAVLADQGKTLHQHISSGVHAEADERWLYEVVNILVDNAVKYCDEKGTIDVNLAAGKKGRGAVISVTNDYADGADVDYNQFFERFYRGDVSHNSQKSGYGIGLSMASEIVKAMKGKLHVAYKDGKISFTVKLN